MIGYLRGKPLVSGEWLTVLVGGVGYEVHAASSTLQFCEGQESVELWVYTHVREDALQLFGFARPSEKLFFLELLRVNGIGPKSALNILSAAPIDKLIQWIDEADTRALSKLPKIGKKTAEQIILTLKGRLVLQEESHPGAQKFAARRDIISALVNLGFRLQDVESVVDQMEPQTTLDTGVRLGLSALTT